MANITEVTKLFFVMTKDASAERLSEINEALMSVNRKKVEPSKTTSKTVKEEITETE